MPRMLFALLIPILVQPALAAEKATPVTVRPADNGQPLVNPDMGWTMHFYSNIPANYGSKLEPADTLDDFPGLSTVYLRVPWAYLEPAEGRFNWALEENRAVIERINRRLGYRLQCRQISWPAAVAIGQPFAVESEWANAGVAPCYPGGYPALTLKDAHGGLVAVLVDDGWNVRELSVGPLDQSPVQKRCREFTAGLIAPVTKPGTYDLFVSVGQRDGTPRIALPLDQDDGQHRYRLGSIRLEQ